MVKGVLQVQSYQSRGNLVLLYFWHVAPLFVFYMIYKANAYNYNKFNGHTIYKAVICDSKNIKMSGRTG